MCKITYDENHKENLNCPNGKKLYDEDCYNCKIMEKCLDKENLNWEEKAYDIVAKDLGYDWSASDNFYDFIREIAKEEYLKGKDFGMNYKQDYADRAYEKGQQSLVESRDRELDAVKKFERQQTIKEIIEWAGHNRFNIGNGCDRTAIFFDSLIDKLKGVK